MVWRTYGCADGVGCDDSQPTPLCIIQGQPLDVSFPTGFAVEGQQVRAEMRAAPAGRLILDMAPYCSVDVLDRTMVRVTLPAEATTMVATSGIYDIWVAGQRIARGPVTTELSVSALPPRNLLAGAWTPVLTMGEPFIRTIEVAGLLPKGEQVSLDTNPEFVVSDLAGDEVLSLIGGPWLTVSPERDTITLSLTAIDVATLGPGRFTYLLRAWNLINESRTLIAGVLYVREGGVIDVSP